jgi:uncharacterized heparinase superfamily protein
LRDDFPDVPLFHRPGRDAFPHRNQTGDVGRTRPDWRLGTITTERLSTVTLHYHAWAYDLAAEDGDLFRFYVADWIDRCGLDAAGARPLAWNAYALATRLSWWIRAYRTLGPARFAAWGDWHDVFLHSLWQQAAYLHDHLEWDLRANHLLRDAVGLAWAGRFFLEEQAGRWLQTATRLAVSQAEEQVLPDGGHFERSPMYHIHVMEDFLTLALLIEDTAARQRLLETWQSMAEYLAWLRHPDGTIALFNDGGLGAACPPAEMLQLGAQASGGVHPRRDKPGGSLLLGARSVNPAPRSGGRHFPDSGMVVWHGRPWSVFLDVGPVGPDYQPGHAHADTLSLECSYQGRRLLVDPGTYGYDRDERRRYDRSTDAHNTVCIDGRDSSEVWHIFRVGRRAYPLGVEVHCQGDGLTATAGHDGYDHLPGGPRHTRRLEVRQDGELTVTDRIDGGGRHDVRGGLLLDPEWTATAAGGGWLLSNGLARLRVSVRGPQSLALSEERRPYHPDYGREVTTTRLCWRVADGLPVEVATRVETV